MTIGNTNGKTPETENLIPTLLTQRVLLEKIEVRIMSNVSITLKNKKLKERRKKEVAEYKDRVLEMTKQRENEKKTHASTVKDLDDKVAELEREV